MDATGLLDYAMDVNRRTGSARAAPDRARPKVPANARTPRPLLGGLAGDPRLPIWVTRAALAAVTAVGITVWQGWRLGLTIAAIVVVADTLLRSRITSVIPAAARVTAAQRRTRRRLKALRPAGYVALHARAIPDSDSVIDHLVIGPGGVFAVDSEMWDRRLPIRTLSNGRLFHGPFSQKDRLAHANWEADQASAQLSEALQRDIKVRPAMVIYGPTVPWHVATLDGVAVLAGGRVQKFFIRQKKISRNVRLEADEIEEIHGAADAALPPVS
jgi:hypothetical protein